MEREVSLVGKLPPPNGKRQLIGLDGRPLSVPPPAQAMAKELVLGLAGMPSFRDALTWANDALKLHSQIPNKGQRITLHLLSTVARWQEEAVALVAEYSPPVNADAADPEGSPAEAHPQPATPPSPDTSPAPASSEGAAPSP